MSGKTQSLPYCWTEGDRLPPLSFDAAQDLTGWVIEFVLQRSDGSFIEKASNTSGITVTNAAKGQFSVTWAVGDLVAGLGQCAQVRFIDALGQAITAPKFLLSVLEAKEPPP